MDANQTQIQLTGYDRELIRCKARQIVGKAGFTRDDIEDIESELTTDLLTRLPKFDPEKAQRDTFADRIVTRRISNLIRYRIQEKRDYRREACSLNEMIVDREGNTVERAQTMCGDAAAIRLGTRDRTRCQEANLRFDVSVMLKGLPEDLRQVAEELKSKSVADTARALGVPRSTLYGAIGRLRVIFAEAGLREYLGESPTS